MKKISDSVLLSRLILKMFEGGLYTQGMVSFHYVFDVWIYGIYTVSIVEIRSIYDAKNEGLI
jgi:hypothetical protein